MVNAENILEISFDNSKHPESTKRGIVNCLIGATFDFAATIRYLYLWDEESKTLDCVELSQNSCNYIFVPGKMSLNKYRGIRISNYKGNLINHDSHFFKISTGNKLSHSKLYEQISWNGIFENVVIGHKIPFGSKHFAPILNNERFVFGKVSEGVPWNS